METIELQLLRRESENLDTVEFILWASRQWELLLASSFGAEDQVLWDLLWQNWRRNGGSEPQIFSLDTGRLPQETYDCIASTEAHYGISVDLVFPLAKDLQRLMRQGGPNLFYQGQWQRKLCCQLRKVEPLRRRLRQHCTTASEGSVPSEGISPNEKKAAWLTGQRRSQSVTRSTLARLEWDEAFALVKLNPLADWSSAEVWNYIYRQEIPYNALHKKGYPSVGCAPCTRAVAPGQDERSGRWWWEDAEHKECGIHIAADGTLQNLSSNLSS